MDGIIFKIVFFFGLTKCFTNGSNSWTGMILNRNKRLETGSQLAVLKGTRLHCLFTCLRTPLCYSLNLEETDEGGIRTCYLLNDASNDVNPLQEAEGWEHIGKIWVHDGNNRIFYTWCAVPSPYLGWVWTNFLGYSKSCFSFDGIERKKKVP